MHAGRAHPRDIGLSEDTAFGHDEPLVRDAREQPQGSLQRDVEGAKIAVVDPDERCGKA